MVPDTVGSEATDPDQPRARPATLAPQPGNPPRARVTDANVGRGHNRLRSRTGTVFLCAVRTGPSQDPSAQLKGPYGGIKTRATDSPGKATG